MKFRLNYINKNNFVQKGEHLFDTLDEAYKALYLHRKAKHKHAENMYVSAIEDIVQ